MGPSSVQCRADAGIMTHAASVAWGQPSKATHTSVSRRKYPQMFSDISLVSRHTVERHEL